jgi:hypothetical protein
MKKGGIRGKITQKYSPKLVKLLPLILSAKLEVYAIQNITVLHKYSPKPHN